MYSGGVSETYKVCEGGLLSKCTRGSWERWVKDVYTNKKIISVWNSFDNQGEATHSSAVNDYWVEHKDLMGEDY